MLQPLRAIGALVGLVLALTACQTAGPPATGTADSAPPSSISLVQGTADPTDLPEGYFAGFGTQWYINIHNWRDGGLGKRRYFEPLQSDLNSYRAAGATVMRHALNVDGGIFWQECNWRADGDYDTRNACYDAAYRAASEAGWATQIAALESNAPNPVFDLYVESALRLQNNGFHVMIVPNDFFWGNGSNWISASADPLLHVYLAEDSVFQDYYVAYVNRLVARMVAGGVTNFSLQTINEPRYCANGPDVRAWTRMERRIIDGARAAAPGLHVVSSAVCTAADRELSYATSYRSLGDFLPNHGVENITYALHMRNPRLLHIADHQSLAEGTRLHYPYQPLSRSAGLTDQSRRQIDIYNDVRPDADFYMRVFEDIARVADRRGVRIVVTEWSISKPDYGLPREDRIALVNDVLAASRATGIPIIYNGLLGREGISSSTDNERRPSHDFDPQILAAFAGVNQ